MVRSWKKKHAATALSLAVAACLAAAGCSASQKPQHITAAGSTAPSSGAASSAGVTGSTSAGATSATPTPTPTHTSASPTTSAGHTSSAPSKAAATKAPPSVPAGSLPPGGCASYSACGFPTASTTGSRIASGSLKAHSGNMEVRTDGMVISGWNLTGSLDVYANNVTVIDSRITSTNWWGINLRNGYGGLKVLHTTIVGTSTGGLDNGGTDYGVSNDSNGGFEVGWCDISQFGAAVSTGHGTVHDNYFHNQAMFINLSNQWVHTDSIISSGADTGGLVIQHNTLINQDPVDKGASASVGLFSDDGPVANTTVTGNWLAGGSYALYGGDHGSSNIHITNNIFSTEISPNGGLYGFVAHWDASGPGNVWSGNRTAAGATVIPEPGQF